MAILHTGGEGVTLREIIEQSNCNNYHTIMVRCLWDYEGEVQDDLIGYCKYEDGILEPLDGDSYSLDDKYVKWQDYDEDGFTNLCVWEQGVFEDE